jgi:hypothetical protein
MPFYRITIFLKDDQVMQGIREHNNSNIDYVTNIYRTKASATYGNNVVDVEAAKLSKNSTAVKCYLEEKLKKLEKKKEWGAITENPFSPTDRKKAYTSKILLGERSGKKRV